MILWKNLWQMTKFEIMNEGEDLYRLLIVEDDKGIAEAIKNQAELWNVQVYCIENFRNVMKEFAEFAPHIILLDIALPFFNGYYWCSESARYPKCQLSLFPLHRTI